MAGTLGTGVAHGGPRRYLALGDSYTLGEGVPEDARWPVRLAARLRALGLALEPPTLVARTGWTTDELAAALDAAPLAPPYDLVSLLIGVNNQYRGRPLAEYRDQFQALLRRAIGYAGERPGRVFVLSIPDWGVTPFAIASVRDRARIAQELDAFNAAARAIASELGVPTIDVTAYSRGPGADQLADDGLHPGAAQYAAWAALAEPIAARLLATP